MADDTDLRERVDKLAGALAQREQREQLSAAVEALRGHAQAAEREFAKERPDYDAAIRHLTAARDRELQIVGVVDPVERRHRITAEHLQQAARDLQAGRNPAESLYGLAKVRGYGAAAPRAASPAPARTKPPGSGGEVVGGPVTPERALKMSDTQFAKFIATPEGKRLLGT